MLLKPLPKTATLQAQLAQAFVLGQEQSPAGPIPKLSTRLSLHDWIGSLRVRLGSGRSSYRALPGLYALGSPDRASPVFVSANYKLSLDALRRELSGIDAWILVLDTKGVNVWCAAGKGSFGNEELAKRLTLTGLGLCVDHRELILPQLSASGVSAYRFQKKTGWKVRFGPVRARDIPAYLARGKEKSAEMRRIDFPIQERLLLSPIELLGALKTLAPYALLLCLAALLAPGAGLIEALGQGFRAFLPLLGAILAGTVLLPMTLPFLPSESFALKGAFLGACLAIALIMFTSPSLLLSLAYLLTLPAISGWYGLMFTGSSTFTSLSGVEIEVRRARLPLILAAALGMGLRLILITGLI